VASKASEVIVVTGTRPTGRAGAGWAEGEVRAQPRFRWRPCKLGQAGISAVSRDADGAVICLGDMPLIDAGLITG